MAMGSNGPSTPRVVQWVLDTRKLWPEATKTGDLAAITNHSLRLFRALKASRAISLLTETERTSVLRYYFVKDAKLALGSVLVKRLAISRYCGVAWDDASPTRDQRTKPVFRLPDGTEPLLFNVSHQAGLVVFLAVAYPVPGTAIGVDVVCQSERRVRDHAMIAKDGWSSYVDVHGEVLCPLEITRLKNLPFTEPDRLLSYFYALWCLREAYVKMTGDALLASWLGELEMRYFAPPGEMGPEGRPLEVWFRGRRVEDVDIRLEPLLDGYMACTSVKGRRGEAVNGTRGLDIGEFVRLDMDEVLTSAYAARVD